jgi:hypothetical protein
VPTQRPDVHTCQSSSRLGAVASLHSATIDCGLMFKFMFCPATVLASIHVRAGPGGKHCSDAVTSGRPAVVFQPKQNRGKKCLTSTMKGSSIMQGCRLRPAPDSSDDADNYASQLEEAAAKKAKRKSQERVCALGSFFDCKFIKNGIARLAREKMAEGGISSIHFRKKRATDLHG